MADFSNESLTILYTYALCGRLDVLPRLYTLIKRLRSKALGAVVLLDLGESCAPASWLCEATAGRALLVALDAMGYDAFYLAPTDMLYSDPIILGKLSDTIVTPVLSDHNADSASLLLTKRAVTGQSFTVWLSSTPLTNQAPAADVTMQIAPGGAALNETVDAMRRTVFLTGQSAGTMQDDQVMLRQLTIMLSPFSVARQESITLSVDELPDATMNSVIEFVESEARYANKRSDAHRSKK